MDVLRFPVVVWLNIKPNICPRLLSCIFCFPSLSGKWIKLFANISVSCSKRPSLSYLIGWQICYCVVRYNLQLTISSKHIENSNWNMKNVCQPWCYHCFSLLSVLTSSPSAIQQLLLSCLYSQPVLSRLDTVHTHHSWACAQAKINCVKWV